MPRMSLQVSAALNLVSQDCFSSTLLPSLPQRASLSVQMVLAVHHGLPDIFQLPGPKMGTLLIPSEHTCSGTSGFGSAQGKRRWLESVFVNGQYGGFNDGP